MNKKPAKIFADEPLEILKNARDQITGSGEYDDNYQENNTPKNDGPSEGEINYKKQIAEKDGRHLEALETELKDIRCQKIFDDLMRRIQSGEYVPLEEFSELSYEQKDVLKAQMEVIKQQKINAENTNDKVLVEPVAKRGRWLMGQKQTAEKQQRRVENPLSPSG